jgi:hypothetical protein
LTSKDRDHFAGVLVGIARSQSTETVDSVAAGLLTRAGWSERYSHQHLARRVLPALLADLELTPTMDRARTLVDEMAADYESYTTVQVVSFPVVNLRVPAEGLQVSDISLRMLDEAAIDELEGQLRAVLTGSRNDEATQEAMIEIFRERYGLLRDGAVAQIRVTGRPEIATERARERYDELVDFLNGAATLLYRFDNRVRVGATGEFAADSETVLVFSEPVEAFSMPMTRVGPLLVLDLTEDHIQKLNDVGYWGYAAVLGTKAAERSEFDSALLLALHWYAEGTVQRLPSNQLLMLTIAAETMFPRGRRRYSCAEGLAFVLEDDADRRRNVRETFLALYRKRGDIAHQGYLGVSSEEVYSLANLVMGMLLTLVARRAEFDDLAELQSWVDDRRLA